MDRAPDALVFEAHRRRFAGQTSWYAIWKRAEQQAERAHREDLARQGRLDTYRFFDEDDPPPDDSQS